MIHRACIAAVLGCLICVSPLRCQNAAGPGIEFTASLRSRVEIWDWFTAYANHGYAYSGNQPHLTVGQQDRRVDWSIEMLAPVLLGLPDDASAPAPQGGLGLGANYFGANKQSRNATMVFPKQAYVSFHNLGASEGHSVRLGRFDFSEGMELTPSNATLAAVKRTRIQQRLIGSFGWSHVGRSYNGIHYSYSSAGGNVTLAGAIPSRGVFQTDGWGFVKNVFVYGAFTKPVGGGDQAGELRFFGIYYRDWRPIGKTDNRLGTVRAVDTAEVNIGTFGGHYIHAASTAAGTVDLLFWGAMQTGGWGSLDHRAGAAAVEGGFQPRGIDELRPWFRGGYFYSTGDNNPGDDRHSTFFSILPTPRIYSRFPFYNLMNMSDVFGEVVLRPHARVTVRSDVHGLRLSEKADLWYAGGGVFNPWVFGYAGRPSQGRNSLATLYDISVDIAATGSLTLGGYYSYASGGGVMAAIYPEGSNAQFGYLEVSYRFPTVGGGPPAGGNR